MIDSTVFSRGVKRARKTLSKRVDAYLNDQSADNVHDLRTATRRVLACLQLLPARTRKSRRTRKYEARLSHLLGANAEVRDIDIILSKLTNRVDSSSYEALSNRLKDHRAAKLSEGLDSASSLRKSRHLSISKEDLNDEKIQKRFDKVNKKLETRIRERLPIVLEDPARKKELHRLRADSRRLRYVLDISGASQNSEQIALLRSWQDILGLTHDCDIMIEFLQEEKQSPELQALLRSEVAERNQNYEKFASMASTKIVMRLFQR